MASTLDLAFMNAVECAMAVIPVPPELADMADLELRSVLLTGPRLYGFSHRACLSLRHPRLRLLAHMASVYDKYKVAESARRESKVKSAGRGSKSFFEDLPNVPSGPSTPPPPPVDLLYAVDCSTASMDGPSALIDEAHVWLDVATYYDELLTVMEDEGGALYGFQDDIYENDNAMYVNTLLEKQLQPLASGLEGGLMGMSTAIACDALRTPLQVCRYRIEQDIEIDTVLRKYWDMLSAKGKGAMETDQVDGTSGVLPATAYITFMTKLCGILYHRDALIDLIDFLVGDLIWDARNLPKSTNKNSASEAEDGQSPSSTKRSYELDTTHRLFSDNESFADTLAGHLAASVYAEAESAKGSAKGPLLPVAALPSLTYAQFKQSMLELVDNWTASTHPYEWSALLWDWYLKVFTINHHRQQQQLWAAKGRAAKELKDQARAGPGGVPARSSVTAMRPVPPQDVGRRTSSRLRGSKRASLREVIGEGSMDAMAADPLLGGEGGSYAKWVDEWRQSRRTSGLATTHAAEDGSNEEAELPLPRQDGRGGRDGIDTISTQNNQKGGLTETEAMPKDQVPLDPNSGAGTPRRHLMRFSHDGGAVAMPSEALPTISGRGLSPIGQGRLSPRRSGNIIIYSVLDWHRQQMREAAFAAQRMAALEESYQIESIAGLTLGTEPFASSSIHEELEREAAEAEIIQKQLRSVRPVNATRMIVERPEPQSPPPRLRAAGDRGGSSSTHHRPNMPTSVEGTRMSLPSHGVQPTRVRSSGSAISPSRISHGDRTAGSLVANAYRCAPIYLYELTTAGMRKAPPKAGRGKEEPDTSPARRSEAPSSPRHYRHYFRGMLQPLVTGLPYNYQPIEEGQ